MTKAEAISAMESGKKVTHPNFSPDEWATILNGQIVLEDGVECSPDEFWKYRILESFDTDWEIFLD